jgi:hypothetical protein
MGTLRSVCHARVFQVRCLTGQSRNSLCKRGFCNDKRQSCFCVRGCNREQPSPFKKRWRKIRLEISWNYKAITWTATLTRTEWKKIIEGVQFVKAGDGFMGEDSSHQDIWLAITKPSRCATKRAAKCESIAVGTSAQRCHSRPDGIFGKDKGH